MNVSEQTVIGQIDLTGETWLCSTDFTVQVRPEKKNSSNHREKVELRVKTPASGKASKKFLFFP